MVKRKTNPRTHITEVQKAFESELYHRLVRDAREPPVHTPLKAEIQERIAEQRELEPSHNLFADGGTLVAQDPFDFPEDPERVAEFEEWLNAKIEDGVLVAVGRDRVISGDHWSAKHIRDASRQGVRHANRELRRAGIDPDDEAISKVLRIPVHKDILRSAFIRIYDELEGVTSEMATEISRTMSDGLAQGKNSSDIARDMNRRVDVGLSRSRRIARTETIRSYNQHAASRFSTQGVEEVDILTSNPCPECRALAEDAPYPIDVAGTLIPNETHPNCVCSLTAVI